jgi:zinc protease
MIRIVWSIVALLLTAAVSSQQLPDRSMPPQPGPVPQLKLPDIQKRTLSNGLRVWMVELHEVPVAQVSLVVRSAGAAADPAGQFGLASMAAELLDEGAGSRDALAIADAVDFLGASLETGSGFDAASIDLHVPVARLDEALPVMADVVLRPTFPERELQRVREELLTSLVQAQDDPASLVEFAFPRLLFGPRHRYGTSDAGTATTAKTFTVDDLRKFHASRYTPADSALIVTGDVTMKTVLPMLETHFGTWKGAAAPAATLREGSEVGRAVFLLDIPGAAQSQIRIGGLGAPRSTPDYFALRVLNTVLGEPFTSRLNLNLREEHGYAYGAGSAFDMRRSAGPFFAAAGVQTDKTAEALREFFNELARIRQPVPADELLKAKNYLALLLPRTFETTGGLASALSEMFIYDLPDDYFATYVDRVRAVSAEDVQRVAQRYIQPDKFIVMIVGDRKAVESGVRALNLGPLRIVTVEEVMR